MHPHELFFDGDAAVHYPGALCGAVAVWDEREDHLHAVVSAGARAAELARVVFVVEHVALEAGACQVVEEDVVGGVEQVGPVLVEVFEPRFRLAGLSGMGDSPMWFVWHGRLACFARTKWCASPAHGRVAHATQPQAIPRASRPCHSTPEFRFIEHFK